MMGVFAQTGAWLGSCSLGILCPLQKEAEGTSLGMRHKCPLTSHQVERYPALAPPHPWSLPGNTERAEL